MISIIFVITFLLLNAIFIFTEKPKSFSDFVIENRSLGTFKLFCTFLATNLSAFTIFGVSGAAYRIGWAFLPVMAFGTGFMAFSFILIGIPLRNMSYKYNWITPSDFISHRLKSHLIGKVVSILLLIYTLPYISIQIGSLGSLLSTVLNIPKWVCSLTITIIITGYVLKGGMKSIVKTDILQLFILYLFAIVSLAVVLIIFKNNPNVKSIFSNLSEVHNRTGKNNSLPFITLAGYYILWLTADPVFPHLTQRFYASKSNKVLIRSMILYPVASLIIFFAMTFIGVIGSAAISNLPSQKSDSIYTILLSNVSKNLSPVFSLAAIAAIMSTLDSQLLSCSSIISNDFMKKYSSFKLIKIIIILIACISFLLSTLPISSILSFLTNSAFIGYSSLFIVYIVAIYFPEFEKSSIIITIFTGFILILLNNLKLIGFDIPFILVILFFEFVILLLTNLTIKFFRLKIDKIYFKNNAFFYQGYKDKESKYQLNKNKGYNDNEYCIKKYNNRYISLKNILVISIIFVLGVDIFNSYIPVKLFFGLPLWLWYHIFITILLSVVFYLLFYKNKYRE
ncbi:MAG: sodium:solute symporter family transporter [Exilispira sp.]